MSDRHDDGRIGAWKLNPPATRARQFVTGRLGFQYAAAARAEPRRQTPLRQTHRVEHQRRVRGQVGRGAHQHVAQPQPLAGRPARSASPSIKPSTSSANQRAPVAFAQQNPAALQICCGRVRSSGGSAPLAGLSHSTAPSTGRIREPGDEQHPARPDPPTAPSSQSASSRRAALRSCALAARLRCGKLTTPRLAPHERCRPLLM